MAKGVGAVEIDGLPQLLKAMKGDLSKEMRKKSRAIAEPIAEEARFLALASGRPMSQALAPAIRAKSDRVPTIVAGSAKRLTSSNAPNRNFFMGAEFGDSTGRYKQFGRPIGGGQSVYPAVHVNRANTARQWFDAIEEVFDR